MMFIDPATGFPLGDPEEKLFTEDFSPDYDKLGEALQPLILSASGWRKVFAADGDEESSNPNLTAEDRLIALVMAEVWASFLIEKSKKRSPVLFLATDSRPTGPSIAHAMLRIFLSRGITVHYSFITAAPEIMAAASTSPDGDGFAYISASHNPLGHNGVKFGLSDGGVIGGPDAAGLISRFKAAMSDRLVIEKILKSIDTVNPDEIISVFNAVPEIKKSTASLYYNFARRVVSGLADKSLQDDFFNEIKKRSNRFGVGIIGELNGSARTLTIDREILENCGILFRGVNDKPRQITHRIVPEGASLDLCRQELETARLEDKRFILGFVPDNDGDRGNIVYYNDATQKAEVLEAQEVFALSVLGELSWLEYLKTTYPENAAFKGPSGVAVNGPTSLRIDSIAHSLNAQVFRAETGEANVVNRARLARESGFNLPILGEGSNGGNITHPAAVRDPLNTIFAILKLLLFPELFKNWCRLTGQDDSYREGFTLSDLISTLPAFTSTSAFEDKALMKIKTMDHILLKKRYEEIFLSQWEEKKSWLNERWGISSFREINYEGTEAREGMGAEFRTGIEKGGLKIELLDRNAQPVGYLWMRGSGTEPVFRVMVDLSGTDPQGEAELLDWHRKMILKADG
ncbi:MAG: hypothetical protein JEY99_11090 [Spirochaetales bacterium]|nr:hypothetical protein [Spirochaetales bacterium]